MSNLKIGVVIFILTAVSGVIFWQKTQTRNISDISEMNKVVIDADNFVAMASASASAKIDLQESIKVTAQTGFWSWNWFKKFNNKQNRQAKVEEIKTSATKRYSLEVNISGEGRIIEKISNAVSIDCVRSKDGKYTGTCKIKFNKGDIVVLAAETPGASFIFLGWGGDCKVEKASICSIVMDGNKKVSAKFNELSFSDRSTSGTSAPSLKSVSQQLPFGISNPYSQKDLDIKAKLPSVLEGLGLSKDGNGIKGFVVDEMTRKLTEKTCGKTTCQEYDFTSAKDLIDLVVGQSEADLWVVLGAPSYYQFTDGKQREDGKTYLPDGPISRQAYKNWLANLVKEVNSYGKKTSGDSDWHIVSWNLFNEVVVDYKQTFGNVAEATTAYANFVIDSAEILRKLSPQSEIVLAGAGSGTDLQGGAGEFYKQVFSKLKQAKLAYEPFDSWESHWFGRGKPGDYKMNDSNFEAKDFIQFLQANGYGDKKFVIRAGAAYSGQDTQERKGFMDNYQSELDQANFLVKRFIYNLANGAKKIAWSTIYERDKYQGEKHVHFQYMSLIYDGYPDGKSKNQECVKGWLPCPDPGNGVKKLSYYSYKKLVEVLKGSGFGNTQIIQEKDGVYVYKLNKQGKPFWVAWNDNSAEKQITISGISSGKVKVTEIIPKYESGKEVIDYGNAFNVSIKEVVGGATTIILGAKPVYIEEIE